VHRTMLIEREIRDFLSSRGVGDDLAAHSDLVSTGILDSLLIMDLIAHVEHAYRVRLENDDISPDNFRTTRALAELVNARRAGVALA
jgi:acyl carrier protein